MELTKISESVKEDGKPQELVYSRKANVEQSETVTLLQMLRSAQNAINELTAWQNQITEVWAGLTKAQKADYQSEYDLSFSCVKK